MREGESRSRQDAGGTKKCAGRRMRTNVARCGIEERFLSARADHFAGAKWKEKAAARSVRNDCVAGAAAKSKKTEALGGGGAEGGGAVWAGADGAKVVVGVQAGVVAVGEVELDGVGADLVGGLGFGFGLEHGERVGRSEGRGSADEGVFFGAFVVAGGAGAFFAEVGEIVVGLVAVSPSDVESGAGGDVDLDGGGFLAEVSGDRHRKIEKVDR